MQAQSDPAPEPSSLRLLASYGGERPGPTLVAVAGMHGNEPSGVEAIRRVIARLEREQPAIRGRFVGLAGNLPALREGVRFIDEDLNRIFTGERVRRARAPLAPGTSNEATQQRELLAQLEAVFEEATGEIVFLDLHTSSAAGEPFVCIGDTLRNRELATRLPVPVLLGLEEQVDGALLEYVNNLGYVTVGVEAGQHDAPESIDNHEAALVLGLIAAGCLDEVSVEDTGQLRARLRRAANGLPSVLEVRYRHPVEPEDRFVMEPGFQNFQRVRQDELLARDRRGPITAPEAGRVLLPLYQGLGSDGFFLVREIRPFWLRVSAWLRRLRLDRILPWLPGVERDSGLPRTLHVDPRVARWYTVEIFHLLGFRKERSRDGKLSFARRVE